MNRFDPVKYSVAENEFLLASVGLPPVVAVRNIPQGVNPAAVRPVLNRLYELCEQEKHVGLVWVGLEAVKDSIKTYLTQAEKWSTDRRRGAPRFPSLYSFDGRQRPHFAGIGSDAGQVKTYFDSNGQRVPFAIDLLPDGIQDWSPDWAGGTDPVEKGLTVDDKRGLLTCEICGHTETFKVEARGSFNAARARMSKHLRSTDKEVEQHRELHTNEYGN